MPDTDKRRVVMNPLAPTVDAQPATPPPTLKEMSTESNLVLLRIETVFPLTIFPTSITIDLHKVSVVKRGLLRIKKTITVNHEDIVSAEADAGPFFAALVITTAFFAPEPLSVNYLHKEDAATARRLINGLLIAQKSGIQLDEPNPAVARQKLLDLGAAHE